MKGGIQRHAQSFSELSQHLGYNVDGEPVSIDKIPSTTPQSSLDLSETGELRKRIGKQGERILAGLFTGSTLQEENFDLIVVSGYDKSAIGIEVKSCKKGNTGVVRQPQMQRYQDKFGREKVYLAQLFYSRVTNRLLAPDSIYIFPLPLITYFTNTLPPTGNNPRMQFHALRMKTANQLVSLAQSRSEYTVQKSSKLGIKSNPDTTLIVVDYKKTPHILSYV